ncbi:protein peste isoform X3 [Agrilus planipennis]|uniref:Protein peste isoform X3 n=1 Tax=Agrilus planipennis TaxID=224129 RepID=A0A7F5REL6_AGRPL|nr:protein peste isoform X3 [Agrilus planipennis]
MFNKHPKARATCSSVMLRRNAFLASLSVVLFGAGFTLLFLWQKILDMILSSQLVLGPDSQLYGLWHKTPVPLDLDLYLWNWTNPEDIYNSSAKFRFQQVGPYRYKETKEKVNITWHNENGTVSFRHLKRFYFDEEGSAGRLDDNITSINPIAISVTHQAKYWGFVAKRGLSMVLNNAVSELHVTKKASEILFDGYEDFFLNVAQSMPFLAGSSMPPFKKFAWFYERNGSSSFEGIFNMETGVGNTIGKLQRWNYWTRTPYFPGECGNVDGSAGELFPPKQKRDGIRFFSTDLCRNVKLDYEQDINVQGVTVYKYSAGRSMLDNGTYYPENSCFCNGECVPYGIMNISSCRYGSPAFVSLPHFYGADPVVLEKIEGVKPQQDKHEFFIALEPDTGLPLRVSARLQLNLLVEPISYIGLLQDAPKLFFPVLWFEQNVSMPDNLIFLVKVLLNLPYIFLSLGTFFITLSLVCVILIVKKSLGIVVCGKQSECKKVLSKEEIPLKMNAK